MNTNDYIETSIFKMFNFDILIEFLADTETEHENMKNCTVNRSGLRYLTNSICKHLHK